MVDEVDLFQMLRDYLERNEIPEAHREYIIEIAVAIKNKSRTDILEEVREALIADHRKQNAWLN